MKKLLISGLALSLTLSCSIFNIQDTKSSNNNKKVSIPIEKVSFNNEQKPEPKILTFSTKAVTQSLDTSFKLPEGKHTKIELYSKKTGEKDEDDKEKIRIPESGSFQIIFEKASKFKITDSNATDGIATVQLPESVMEGFIRLQDEGESKSLNKLTIEDKLYYTKQDLSVLSPSESKDNDKDSSENKFSKKDSKDNEKDDDKDKWYRIGKRPFPVPNNWYSDDGNKYILSFNNSGIKKAEFRWFKTDKPDFPMNLTEVTPEAGGVIDFKGVGKMEIPAGAVTSNTVVTMKEEKEVPEIIKMLSTSRKYVRRYDFISPVVKIEPFNLEINKPATLYLEYDKDRLGNNTPVLIHYNKSIDKKEWDTFDDILSDNEFYNMKAEISNSISKFSYVTRLISAFIKPGSGIKHFDPNKSEGFNTKQTQELPPPAPIVVLNDLDNKELSLRSIYAYKTFKDLTGFSPKGTNRNRIEINYSNDESNLELNLDGSNSSFKTLTGKTIENKNNLGTTYLNIQPDDYVLERELWHHFQLAMFPKDENNKVKYYDTVKENNVHNWWIKSSAQYMGAYAYKKGKNESIHNGAKFFHYLDEFKHRNYLVDRNMTFPITRSKIEALSLPSDSNKVPEEYLADYYNFAFFSFLTDSKTNFKQMRAVIDLYKEADKFENSLPSKYFIEEEALSNNKKVIKDRFHEFAVHDAMLDRYSLFSDSEFSSYKIEFPNLISSNISKNNTIEDKNTLKINNSIENLAVKYYKITSSDLNNTNLSIKVDKTQNSCDQDLNVSAIFYPTDGSNPKDFIKTLPQYSSKPEFMPDGSVKLNKGEWTTFNGFKSKFDKVVLVVSNSNGAIGSRFDCNYNIQLAYSCNIFSTKGTNKKGCS